jgi:hypothetical protein
MSNDRLGILFPNEDKFIPPQAIKVKKKMAGGTAGIGIFEVTDPPSGALLGLWLSDQPFLLTLPDLDEELEDREEDELDRPDEEERLEEDPPDRATLEERPEEEPLDLGALKLRPEEPLEREGAE